MCNALFLVEIHLIFHPNRNNSDRQTRFHLPSQPPPIGQNEKNKKIANFHPLDRISTVFISRVPLRNHRATINRGYSTRLNSIENIHGEAERRTER